MIVEEELRLVVTPFRFSNRLKLESIDKVWAPPGKGGLR